MRRRTGIHNWPLPLHRAASLTPPFPPGLAQLNPDTPVAGSIQERVYEMVRNYRVRGHMIAAVNPLGAPRPCLPELELDFYGFYGKRTESARQFRDAALRNAADRPRNFPALRNTYCRSIGAQFMHIDDPAMRQWLQHRMESSQNHLELSRDEQLRILTRLTDAVVFEEFLRKKFLGAKTFSLEGCETLIAAARSGH